MLHFFYIILKTTIMFCILLFLARILGKKQMSHLTFFNYITGITIGSIAANVLCDPNIPKSSTNQLPLAIIIDGKLNQYNLKQLNLNEEWVHSQLVKHNISSIKEVLYAESQNNTNIIIQRYN